MNSAGELEDFMNTLSVDSATTVERATVEGASPIRPGRGSHFGEGLATGFAALVANGKRNAG